VIPLILGTPAPIPTAAARRGLSSVSGCARRDPLRKGRGRGSATAALSLNHHQRYSSAKTTSPAGVYPRGHQIARLGAASPCAAQFSRQPRAAWKASPGREGAELHGDSV
jgi:hypothetical protein